MHEWLDHLPWSKLGASIGPALAVAAGSLYALLMSETLRGALTSLGLLLLGSAATFLATWFWTRRRERADQSEKTNLRIIELEKQLASMSAAVVPIATAFQAILIKELTHFHTPVMDALLVKVGPPYMLTPAEEAELYAALKERAITMNGLIDEAEREAAEILPAVIRRAKHETDKKAPVEVQLVSLPEGTAEKARPATTQEETPKTAV